MPKRFDELLIEQMTIRRERLSSKSDDNQQEFASYLVVSNLLDLQSTLGFELLAWVLKRFLIDPLQMSWNAHFLSKIHHNLSALAFSIPEKDTGIGFK